MDPILNQLHTTAQTLTHHPPTTPLISNLTGPTPHHHHPRLLAPTPPPTRPLPDATHTLTHHGVTHTIEIGPDTTLTNLTKTTHPHLTTTPLLHPHKPENHTVAHAIGTAYALGSDVDWTTVVPDAVAVDLPTYPFQRERYWLDGPTVADGQPDDAHPLLPVAVELADGGVVLTGTVAGSTPPWLAGHEIAGRVLLPGAALVEVAAHAAARFGLGVGELTLTAPVPVDTPVRNPEVDDGWLCDRGRYGFEMFNAEERVRGPRLRGGTGRAGRKRSAKRRRR